MRTSCAQVPQGVPFPLRSQMVRGDDHTNRSYRRGAPWFLLLVSFLGFLVSLYLTFMHYRGVIPTCYVVQGCDVVQTSRYSAILGVPIALFGTMFFVLMFYLGIGLTTSQATKLVLTYKVLAYAGALAAIPLFLLQAVVLRAFCTYCLVTEVVLLLMWGGSFALRSSQESAGAVEIRIFTESADRDGLGAADSTSSADHEHAAPKNEAKRQGSTRYPSRRDKSRRS